MIIIRVPQANRLTGLILGPESAEEEALCEKLAKQAAKKLEFKAPKIPKFMLRPKRIRKLNTFVERAKWT
jgi:hypothetical protein